MDRLVAPVSIVIPKGLRPTAQGCRTRLPWVSDGSVPTSHRSQPQKGLRSSIAVSLAGRFVLHRRHATPVGSEAVKTPVPRVAEYGNLGLEDAIPLGLSETFVARESKSGERLA